MLVVVHTDADALLIKRADHPDFWQSVTGSLELGEQPYAAALRELAEETGIHVPSLRATGITRSYEILDEWKPRYAAGVTRNYEHLFYCKLDAQCDITLDPCEHTDYQWLPFAQACERVYSWSNRLSLLSLR